MCQYWQTIYIMNGISMISSTKLKFKIPRISEYPDFDVFDIVNNYRSVPNFTKVKKACLVYPAKLTGDCVDPRPSLVQIMEHSPQRQLYSS